VIALGLVAAVSTSSAAGSSSFMGAAQTPAPKPAAGVDVTGKWVMVLDKRQLVFQVALSAEGQDVTMFFSGEVSADGLTIAKGIVNIEGLGEGSWAAKKDKTH
jgi:hypothetical protein